MELKGQSVIIVGGSSGLGLATANAAVRKGANVTITGRSYERLSSAQSSLGGQVEIVKADALCEPDMENLFKRRDGLDHLLVTVGSYVADHNLEPSINDLRRPVDDRLLAALHATKYGFPHINSAGSITLMSGTAVVRPITGTSMSSASCGAIEGLARGLAIDFAPIRVNALRAGFFDTPFLDEALGNMRATVVADLESRLLVGRIGKPDEAASAVTFLMENDYVTGSCLTIDGGGSLI